MGSTSKECRVFWHDQVVFVFYRLIETAYPSNHAASTETDDSPTEQRQVNVPDAA
jgi:hypothetical protein